MGNVSAQDDLIHSDIPLFSYDSKYVWPKRVSDADSVGCIHPIKLGYWEYREQDEIERWFRLDNYGAFHCFIVIRDARDHEALDYYEGKLSRLIQISKFETTDRGRRVLWALQIGGKPGSDYLFLTSYDNEIIATTFEVLQRDCPDKNIRMSSRDDDLDTQYCAINTQEELIALAKEMASRPALGHLSFVNTDE